MSTIITDGRLLLADTRCLTSATNWIDRSQKIFDVAPNGLIVEGKYKLLAYGYIGDGRAGDFMKALIVNAPAGSDVITMLRMMLSAKSHLGEFSLLLVCEAGHVYSMRVMFDSTDGGANVSMTHMVLSGTHHYVGIGEGAVVARGLNGISPRQSLTDVFITAAYLDGSSSTDYWSFDTTTQESKFNEPDQTLVLQTVRRVMRSVAADPNLPPKRIAKEAYDATGAHR